MESSIGIFEEAVARAEKLGKAAREAAEELAAVMKLEGGSMIETKVEYGKTDSNVDEQREAVRKVIGTEVRNLLDEEMRKAAQELLDEQREAIRQIVEEQRVAIREAVEEEKKALRTRLEDLRKSILMIGPE